jgi:hypothetical protein
LHVNDLADYVSESGEIAGRNAARYAGESRRFADISISKDFLYTVPQRVDIDHMEEETVMFFRSSHVRGKTTLRIIVNNKEVFTKKFRLMRPPEMERIAVDFGGALRAGSKITLRMETIL